MKVSLFLVICIITALVYNQISLTGIHTPVGVLDQWSEGTTSSPVYYEKDGKGIIFSSWYWGVFAIDVDSGETIFKHNTYTGYQLEERFETGIVMIENLYAQGDVAFIIGAGMSEITVWNEKGELLHTRQVDPSIGRRTTNILAEKLSDTDPWSIIVGLPSSNMNRYPNTWILDPYLVETWKRPLKDSAEGSFSLGVFGNNIATYDLNGDGNKEIIVPSDDYSVCIWNKFGEQWGVSTDVFPNANNWWSHVIFSKDYSLEFRGWAGSHHDLKPFFAHGLTTVVPVNEEPIIAISGFYNSGFDTENVVHEYHTVFLLKENRERFYDQTNNYDWREAYEGCKPLQEAGDLPFIGVPISYADLDNDGNHELIFPCTDGRIHAIKLDKTQVYMNWPFDLGSVTTNSGLKRASEVMIFQKPGTCPYLIFTTYGQRANKGYYGKLIILDCQGTMVDEVTLPKPTGDHGSGSISGPTLFKKTYVENSNIFVAIQSIYSGMLVYEIMDTSDAVILWQTQRGSFLRNGNPPSATSFPFVKPVDIALVRTISGTIVGISIGGITVVIFIVAIAIIFIFALVANPLKIFKKR